MFTTTRQKRAIQHQSLDILTSLQVLLRVFSLSRCYPAPFYNARCKPLIIPPADPCPGTPCRAVFCLRLQLPTGTANAQSRTIRLPFGASDRRKIENGGLECRAQRQLSVRPRLTGQGSMTIALILIGQSGVLDDFFFSLTVMCHVMHGHVGYSAKSVANMHASRLQQTRIALSRPIVCADGLVSACSACNDAAEDEEMARVSVASVEGRGSSRRKMV